MVQNAFQIMNQLNHGICILNGNFSKIYENEAAKRIFRDQCPELYQQLKTVCRNDSKHDVRTGHMATNSIMTHSGTLRYPYGTVVFHCAALGEGHRSCIYIIFEFIAEPEHEFFDDKAITPRENDILRLVTEGKTNKEISTQLGIGLETVKSHIRKLFAKTRTSSRVELVGKVLRGMNLAKNEAVTRRKQINKKMG